MIEVWIENTDVLGAKQVKSIGGQGIFSNLTFIAAPGSIKVPFKISSTSINNDLIKQNYNLDSEYRVNELIVYIDFRDCIRGEADQ